MVLIKTINKNNFRVCEIRNPKTLAKIVIQGGIKFPDLLSKGYGIHLLQDGMDFGHFVTFLALRAEGKPKSYHP